MIILYVVNFCAHKIKTPCIYKIVCITSHYNRNYLEKYIVNQKILMNKISLEYDFTYAMQISSRSVNPLSYFIYIYENYNRNYLEK